MRFVAGAALVAATGVVAHNLLSLPLSPLAPETIAPLAVYAALLGWLVLAGGAAARAAMLAWAALSLFGGGIVSVLPLPLLPFAPQQTAEHYVAHVIYTVTQVPLFASVWRMHALRRGTM